MALNPTGEYEITFQDISGSKLQAVIDLADDHGKDAVVTYLNEKGLNLVYEYGDEINPLFKYRVYISDIYEYEEGQQLDREIDNLIKSD